MADLLVYDSAQNNNRYGYTAPRQSPGGNFGSWLERFAQAARPSPAPIQAYYAPQQPGHGAGIVSVLRQYSEGLLVGGIAGTLEAELKNGLDVAGVPIDAGAAVVAGGLAMLMRGSEASVDMRNVGSHAGCVYSYRMMNKLRRQIIRKQGGVPGGTSIAGEDDDASVAGDGDDDPILRAAKAMTDE